MLPFGDYFFHRLLTYRLQMNTEKNLETVKDRIQFILETEGLTAAAFARALGVSSAFIYYLRTGKSSMSNTTAQAIETIFGYSAEWLLNGTPPMETNELKLSPVKQNLIRTIRSMSEAEVQTVASFVDALKEHLK